MYAAQLFRLTTKVCSRAISVNNQRMQQSYFGKQPNYMYAAELFRSTTKLYACSRVISVNKYAAELFRSTNVCSGAISVNNQITCMQQLFWLTTKVSSRAISVNNQRMQQSYFGKQPNYMYAAQLFRLTTKVCSRAISVNNQRCIFRISSRLGLGRHGGRTRLFHYVVSPVIIGF